MVTNFTRVITHNFDDYNKSNQKASKDVGEYSTIVKKKIHKSIIEVPKDKKTIINDNFMYIPTNGTVVPFIGGGISLIFVLGLLLVPTSEPLKKADWFIVYLCSFLTLFFVFYLLTKPKKEKILNRRDGLITISGFYWQKNITMHFDDTISVYSTGGGNLVGAFLLEMMRPTTNRFNSFESMDFMGECYKSMSFITWYMDKNRPLPPGEAFDEYRKADFERRKAEGFPKPLYPSKIKTPEATKEQQEERKRIGGW